LDPAGFAFESKMPEVRLARTDALFVDVIHTDGEPILSFGKLPINRALSRVSIQPTH